MTEQVNGANGSDKAGLPEKALGAQNGASHEIAAVRDRPSSIRPSADRAIDAGAAAFDGFRTLNPVQHQTAKLQVSTRVVNAFMAHITTVCNRPADQMTEADVATLGGILASLERLEVTPKRTSYAS